MFSLREEITKTLLRLKAEGGAAPGGADAGRDEANQPDPRESRTYGDYRILRHLGTGGMGCVYLALDTRLGRHVAIKFLPLELARDGQFLRRFEQEARTASSLNHPNIVTIFDFTEIEGEAILVSEFIEGVTLRHVLDREALTVETALAVAMQVTSALTAAHAAGIVHRDLKPTNVMLRPDGYVKVIDFGLAKFTARRRGDRRRSEMTKPGSVLGTVDYLSPEQARGDEVDARTDLWSLGVVMYEMLAHRRPFQGETDSHVIVDILDNRPTPLPQAGELAPALASIVERALEKDRKRRYQSANDLLLDLKKVQGGSTVPTSGATAIAKIAQPVISRRRQRQALAAGIAGLTALLIVFWWLGMHGRERVLGPNWFDFAASKRVTFEGDVSIATISPDGKYLAYIAAGATSRLRLRNLRNGADSGLPATSGEYTGLSFSPDSKTVYYVLREGEIGRVFTAPVIGIADSPSRLLFENADGPLAFSPSGREFAFVRSTTERGRANNSIMLGHEANSRNPEPIVSLSGTQIREQLAWSPQNDWIAAITYPSSLKAATRGTVSLFDRRGKLLHTFAPTQVRSLFVPIALDRGSLLLFSGVPESGIQHHLVQLYVPTGEFHETAADPLGFDSISATADSRTLASVRMDQRSSVWVAAAEDLHNARKLTPDAEPIPQVSWLSNDEMVFPSTRTGEVNLSRLKMDKTVLPVGGEEHCVEQFPVGVPGRRIIVYASNCAHGGDDFNIWTLNLATGTRHALTGGSSYDYQPEISPDGRWIIYTSWSSDVASLWKIPVGGGIPTVLPAGQAKLPFFSPDGKKVVAQVREPFGPWQVAILDAADGVVLQRFPHLPAGVLPVRWSPDGQALDYIRTGNGSAGIWRQPLAGGPAEELLSISEDSISDFSWTRDGSKIAYVRSRAQRDVILFYRK